MTHTTTIERRERTVYDELVLQKRWVCLCGRSSKWRIQNVEYGAYTHKLIAARTAPPVGRRIEEHW